MNYTRILLAGIAAWIASIALGFLIHDIWLMRLYQANAWAYRRMDDVAELVPIGMAAQLLGSLAFAYAYAKGYDHNREVSGVAQGVRFGLIVAIIVDGFAVAWNYVTEPIALRLGILEVLAVIAQFGVCGAIVGMTYQPGRIVIRHRAEEKYDLRG